MTMQAHPMAAFRAQAVRQHPLSSDGQGPQNPVEMLRLYRGILAGLAPAAPPVIQFTGSGPAVGTSSIVAAMGDAISRTRVRAASLDLSANETGLDPLIGRSRPLGRDPGRDLVPAEEAGFPFLDPSFDIVLVDSAPIRTSPLAMAMASTVGGTVLVVESDRSVEAEIREALRSIEDCGGRCLGIVLNKLPVPRKRWWHRRGR